MQKKQSNILCCFKHCTSSLMKKSKTISPVKLATTLACVGCVASMAASPNDVGLSEESCHQWPLAAVLGPVTGVIH
jgi:hypothetical protein